MHILTLSCPDKPGIVARVSGCLHQSGCNIEDASQFREPDDNYFFMRVVFSGAEDTFLELFETIATDYNINWRLTPLAQPVKTLILVSQWDHCLNDLLYRWRTKHLNIEITGVVSNHEHSRQLVEERGLPFHYLPVTAENKTEQEKQIHELITASSTELILLARYMQIMSQEFCQKYTQNVINIHHSFLPGFKGAKPYAQAYKRGVKMIGATAHFVTDDLDEGPIITQNVMPIDHTHTPEKMQNLGRDLEALTLARATELYTERRIFLHNGRTVIL